MDRCKSCGLPLHHTSGMGASCWLEAQLCVGSFDAIVCFKEIMLKDSEIQHLRATIARLLMKQVGLRRWALSIAEKFSVLAPCAGGLEYCLGQLANKRTRTMARRAADAQDREFTTRRRARARCRSLHNRKTLFVVVVVSCTFPCGKTIPWSTWSADLARKSENRQGEEASR